MRRITDYLTMGAVVAVSVNLLAAKPTEERAIAEYLRSNMRGRILELTIDSSDGKKIGINLSYKNFYGRDSLVITQPISSEQARKRGLELPSGTLGMNNNEPENNLDGIVNVAFVNPSDSQEVRILNLKDSKMRQYIQSLYDHDVNQVYQWIKNRNSIKA